MSLYLGDNLISNSISVPYNWSGTLAEYANLPEIHEDWIYCITDDVPPTTEIYSKTEVNTLLNGKAGTDLSNLSATGRKAFLNKQQITNCILEDPQNIKLTLSNGTLTLKAGSVVCVPNGFEADGTTPKFDEVTVASDISTTYSDGSQYVFYTKNNGTGFGVNQLSTCNSGATDTGVSWHLWYDTANNIIQRKNGSTVLENNCSFPVCIYYGASSTITSIDQTFQSIGYIGSTVFVRKGLKVLIPNGRNADGSLKNIEVTTNKVLTETLSNTVNGTYSYYITRETTYSKQIWRQLINYDWVSTTEPTQHTYSYWYNPQNNIAKRSTDYASVWNSDWASCKVFTCLATNGVISNFQPYTATNILKYSDKPQISGWSMPSSRCIDLTLGASGSTYIAPANGWVQITVSGGAFIEAYQGYMHMYNTKGSSENWYSTVIPVKKGIFGVDHNGGVTKIYFRFIYAEGEQ